MNIAVAHKITPADSIDDRYLPIQQFFEEHSAALRNAARLLGGGEGISLVDEIVDALSRDDDLPRRTIGLLHELEDLLALEHVGDPDRSESEHFAAIDIFDPVVEEICLLTDGLNSAIAALHEHQRDRSAGFDSTGSGHVSRPRCRVADTFAFSNHRTGDAQ
ncbi:hypothetical protein [Roseovarius nanhaiticus]|uniref:hypothetical protein n=1 Tax=Roseovarius nanhaiticus TaxID=573024 RepID=UPI0024923719|nr:hypothetical protein [Roseovarius nanhaiticus]